MRLLDRYLLRELLVPLVYCLCGFLLLWVTADLLNELGDFQKKKLHAGDIAAYYLATIPEHLPLLLPMALLLALLYALTNHARHNEITAIRAAGVSLWRLCLPYLGVGLAASLLLFAISELWMPRSLEAETRILTRRLPRPPGYRGPNWVRNFGFTNNRDGRAWKIGLYNIETTEMLEAQVIWNQPDGSTRWISADRAIRTNDVWTFENVREHDETGQTNSFLVPTLQTNVLAFPEFAETPEQIKSEIKLANTFTMRGAKRPDIPISEILSYLHLHPNPKRSDRCWLYTKLHGRLAAPWTCLVVVLIAIPFGTVSGRRNVFVGVASSIFICFIYFVLLQLGMALGTGGYVAPWLAAWSPNLVFGLVGLALTMRVR